MFHYFLAENVAFAALGVYFLGFGLRGILTKKPFVTSTLQILWIFLILFVPPLLSGGSLIFSDRNPSFVFTNLFLLIMILVLLFVFWQNRGYSIWGATDGYLQDALRAALKKLNLPYEESVARLRLVSLGADLTVSTPGFGTGYIRVKPARHASTLKQVAGSLKEYFASVPGKMSFSIFYIYTLFGVLLLAQTAMMVTSGR